MSSTIFEGYTNAIEMQWTCIKCGLPNKSGLLFDSNMSSIQSSLNLHEDLRVATVNFQSIYNKKDELTSFLIENNVGIVLGSCDICILLQASKNTNNKLLLEK